MTNQDLNQRFAELMGIDEGDFCICGLNKEAHRFETHSFVGRDIPDFVSDPRLVLREMMKRDDYNQFLIEKIFKYGWTARMTIELFLDTTGLLVKAAIKFLEKGEGKGEGMTDDRKADECQHAYPAGGPSICFKCGEFGGKEKAMTDENMCQLINRHAREIQEFQDDCPHETISDWMPYMWAPGHYGADVQICLRCHKTMRTRT